MATVDANLSSGDGNDAKMSLRLRGDLKFTRRLQGLANVWVIKDPVSFTHFQFSEREFFLANLFDGDRTIGEVLEAWQRKFRSRSLTKEQVKTFAVRLVNDNLAVVEKIGYGRSLFHSNSDAVKSKRFGWMMSPLAIRFRGVNPSSVLRELDWFGRVFFHPATICVLMTFAVGVLLLLSGNFESVAERIPAIESMISTQGILSLVLTLAIVKVLHEFGHALACRRYGGECFEIGVMLLALIPTLYCNVSDAWTINSRWKRMMVSFAGMYVEICLAATAGVFWFLTPPGLLNAMLFNVVLLCSVNTVLVNGNPLLRYDGYYLLSDWIEKPNLSAAANKQLGAVVSNLFWKPQQRSEFSAGLLAYGLLSFLYRWFVVGVILWAIFVFAARWGAGEIGLWSCGLLLLMMVSGRAKQMIRANVSLNSDVRSNSRSRSNSNVRSGLSWSRSVLSLLVAAALIAFVCFIPLPRSVYGEFEVALLQSSQVFSPHDGKVVSMAKPYERVSRGDEVARLENHVLEQQTAQLEIELNRAKNELTQLKSRNQINSGLGGNGRPTDASELASRIKVAKNNVAALEERLFTFREQLSRMVILSPSDGVVFPVSEHLVASSGEFGSEESEIRIGSVSEPGNRFCLVKSSQHLMTIGAPALCQIQLLVNEADIGLVASGQMVRLRFDRILNEVFEGTVGEIFETRIEQVRDDQTPLEELTKQYRVVIELEEMPAGAVSGSLGRGRISTAKTTIGSRAMQALKRAMNTRL